MRFEMQHSTTDYCAMHLSMRLTITSPDSLLEKKEEGVCSLSGPKPTVMVSSSPRVNLVSGGVIIHYMIDSWLLQQHLSFCMNVMRIASAK